MLGLVLSNRTAAWGPSTRAATGFLLSLFTLHATNEVILELLVTVELIAPVTQ